MGIAVTLSLVNEDTKIHLGTDSSAAIVAIGGYMDRSIYRKVTRYKCGLILEIIREMLNKKNIQLYLYKIDAYSNHKWNDRADALAKMGVSQEEIFTLNLNRISQLSYHYKRDDIVPDVPIKETLKKINRLKHIVELTNLV